MLLNQFQIFCFDPFAGSYSVALLRQVNMQHLFSINLINWNKSCIKAKERTTATQCHGYPQKHTFEKLNISLSRTICEIHK